MKLINEIYLWFKNHKDLTNKKVLITNEVKTLADKFGTIAIYEFPEHKASFFSSALEHDFEFKLNYRVSHTNDRQIIKRYVELLPYSTYCFQNEYELNEFLKKATNYEIS